MQSFYQQRIRKVEARTPLRRSIGLAKTQGEKLEARERLNKTETVLANRN